MHQEIQFRDNIVLATSEVHIADPHSFALHSPARATLSESSVSVIHTCRRVCANSHIVNPAARSTSCTWAHTSRSVRTSNPKLCFLFFFLLPAVLPVHGHRHLAQQPHQAASANLYRLDIQTHPRHPSKCRSDVLVLHAFADTQHLHMLCVGCVVCSVTGCSKACPVDFQVVN